MSQEIINVGAVPNDHTGDPFRDAFIKVNDNFTDVYGQINVLGNEVKPGKLYNVLNYGATGIGADDTAAIQAADTAATAAGGALYFPSGIYGVALGGIIRGGCSWIGDSPYTSILKSLAVSYSTANTGLVSCINHLGWTVEKLGFDVSAAMFTIASPGVAHFTGSIAGTVLTVTAVTDGTIAFNSTMKIAGINISAAPTIISAGTGLGGVGTYNISASQATASTAIIGSPISANFYYIFRAQGCNNWVLRDCVFSGIQPYVLAASIVAGAVGSINWTIEDCVFTMPSPSPFPNQAINISIAGGGLNDNWIVARNILNGSGLFSNATNGLIIGNKVNGAAYGAGLASGLGGTDNHAYINNDSNNCVGVDANSVRVSGIESYSKDSRIIGNRCYNNAGYGIKFGGDNAVVVGNICKNNGQIGAADTSTNYGGITALTPATIISGLSASNAIVNNNNCYDDQGTATQEYGYSEAIVGSNTMSGNLVSANKFFGNLLGDYKLAAAAPKYSNGSTILIGGGVPSGVAPSGTMANNGAVTLGTALDATFSAGIYLYFPVNAIFAGSSAGSYFCIMSSATVGTVYNNLLPTTTAPLLPTSNTSFATTGPGAYTAVTASLSTAATYTIPANSMGRSGLVRLDHLIVSNQTANGKLERITWGGTQIFQNSVATANNARVLRTVRNCGATNFQISEPLAMFGTGASANTVSPIYPAIDTTADVSLICLLQLTTAATDWVYITPTLVEIFRGGD